MFEGMCRTEEYVKQATECFKINWAREKEVSMGEKNISPIVELPWTTKAN